MNLTIMQGSPKRPGLSKKQFGQPPAETNAKRYADAQDRVIKQAQPLLDSPVAGDDKAGLMMSGNDEFVEVGRLLAVSPHFPYQTGA